MLSDVWERGDPYERYIGRWSRQIAPLFLDWLHCAGGQRWLDIGCGTGALSTAILRHAAPDWAVGMEPSAGFVKAAQKNLEGQVALLQGTAAAIPLNTASVDVVVSGLVLNFIPDPRAALVEMARVLRPGGVIGAYVWDYAGKMELLRLFWDCAAELDSRAAQLDEGQRFPICSPAALRALFAGLAPGEVSLTAIDIPAGFADFEDYWQPFLGGQGPAPAYVMALDTGARARLRDLLRQRIPQQADGSISLVARAWAVMWRSTAN